MPIGFEMFGAERIPSGAVPILSHLRRGDKRAWEHATYAAGPQTMRTVNKTDKYRHSIFYFKIKTLKRAE